jgi:hypothetical protein
MAEQASLFGADAEHTPSSQSAQNKIKQAQRQVCWVSH